VLLPGLVDALLGHLALRFQFQRRVLPRFLGAKGNNLYAPL
jgi:hypothetical protein